MPYTDTPDRTNAANLRDTGPRAEALAAAAMLEASFCAWLGRTNRLLAPCLDQRKNRLGGRFFLWCSIVDAFQTAATLAQEDYKLKHLAEQFRLADNLI